MISLEKYAAMKKKKAEMRARTEILRDIPLGGENEFIREGINCGFEIWSSTEGLDDSESAEIKLAFIDREFNENYK